MGFKTYQALHFEVDFLPAYKLEAANHLEKQQIWTTAQLTLPLDTPVNTQVRVLHVDFVSVGEAVCDQPGTCANNLFMLTCCS